MNAIFPELPHTLGVYMLTHHIGTQEHSEVYAATQSHVDRKVVIEVLRPGSPQTIVSQFLKTARARVAAKLPNVASVFESMVSDGTWYITQENPPGTSLEVLHRQGEQLTPLQICTILEMAAKLYITCAKSNLQVAPLRRANIFLASANNNCSARFLSPVYDNAAAPTTETELIAGLAEALIPMQPTNTPGQTRIATLLQWMLEGYEGQYLDWSAVEYTAGMLMEQLGLVQENLLTATTENSTPASIQRAKLRQRRKHMQTFRFALKCIVPIFFCALVGSLLAPAEPVALSPQVGDYITCTTDHDKSRVYVAKAPVSIVDYERFLADYANMSTAEKADVNRGLPDGETDHTPAEWNQQLQAVANKKQWQGRQLSEDSPVAGVSFWDARAYANYRRANIPNAATIRKINEDAEISGLQEWTTDTTQANTIHTAGHVVIHANGRNTLFEPDRKHRNTARSFRIVLPFPPNS